MGLPRQAYACFYNDGRNSQNQFPDADEAARLSILEKSLELQRKLEGRT